jgi:hypothetical protein
MIHRADLVDDDAGPPVDQRDPVLRTNSCKRMGFSWLKAALRRANLTNHVMIFLEGQTSQVVRVLQWHGVDL